MGESIQPSICNENHAKKVEARDNYEEDFDKVSNPLEIGGYLLNTPLTIKERLLIILKNIWGYPISSVVKVMGKAWGEGAPNHGGIHPAVNL